MPEEKIPLEQVLDDMYNPNGGMPAQAARDYYYNNYATDEEKQKMDAEDRRFDRILKFIVGLFCGFIIYVVIKLMF